MNKLSLVISKSLFFKYKKEIIKINYKQICNNKNAIYKEHITNNSNYINYSVKYKVVNINKIKPQFNYKEPKKLYFNSKCNFCSRTNRNKFYEKYNYESKQTKKPLDVEILYDDDHTKYSDTLNKEFKGNLNIAKFKDFEYVILETKYKHIIYIYLKIIIYFTIILIIGKFGIYNRIKALFYNNNKSNITANNILDISLNETVKKVEETVTSEQNNKESIITNNNKTTEKVKSNIYKKKGIVFYFYNMSFLFCSLIALYISVKLFYQYIDSLSLIIRKMALSNCGRKVHLYYLLKRSYTFNLKFLDMLPKEEYPNFDIDTSLFFITYGYPIIIKNSFLDINDIINDDNYKDDEEDVYEINVVWNKSVFLDKQLFTYILNNKEYIKITKNP